MAAFQAVTACPAFPDARFAKESAAAEQARSDSARVDCSAVRPQGDSARIDCLAVQQVVNAQPDSEEAWRETRG
jgi:hypothetical protein